MRELVYLSERKLSQFLLDPDRWWNSITGISATPIGGIQLKNNQTNLSNKLNAIIKHLKAAKRFDDPTVKVGDWIIFLAALRPFLFSGETETPVVFVEPPGHDRKARLLLHGSERHLVGHTVRPFNPEFTEKDHVPIQGLYEWSGAISFASFVRRIMVGIPERASYYNSIDSPKKAKELEQKINQYSSYEGFWPQLHGLYDELDILSRDASPSEPFRWMSGHARITAKSNGRVSIILASPLYIQYASAPQA